MALYSGHAQVKGSLGHAYGLSGEIEKASRLLGELQDLSKTAYVSPWLPMILYAGMGDKERALTWLEKAMEERVPSLVWLKVHPELDPLRSEPRFAGALTRLGFPD